VTADGGYETPSGATPAAAGTYYWVATYSPDANNKEAKSGCADEPVTVGHAPAAVVSQATVVAPAKVVSGVATPHGPLECVASTARVYIEGRQIASATFYLDGHKMKTLTKADRTRRFGITVSTSKLTFGVHRVKVQVVFKADSETKPETMRVLIFRCRPPRPSFTG
jgi:hypothetical protein